MSIELAFLQDRVYQATAQAAVGDSAAALACTDRLMELGVPLPEILLAYAGEPPHQEGLPQVVLVQWLRLMEPEQKVEPPQQIVVPNGPLEYRPAQSREHPWYHAATFQLRYLYRWEMVERIKEDDKEIVQQLARQPETISLALLNVQGVGWNNYVADARQMLQSLERRVRQIERRRVKREVLKLFPEIVLTSCQWYVSQLTWNRSRFGWQRLLPGFRPDRRYTTHEDKEERRIKVRQTLTAPEYIAPEETFGPGR